MPDVSKVWLTGVLEKSLESPIVIEYLTKDEKPTGYLSNVYFGVYFVL